MSKLFYNWRYYSFGHEQYRDCLSSLFSHNLLSLRQINTIFAIFASLSAAFPLFVEKDYIKTGVCIFVALIAFLISTLVNYRMQTAVASNRATYTILIIYYVNVMLFGIYLCIFSAPIGGFEHRVASVFLWLLICALLMFVTSPFFNFFCTLSAVVVFITLSVIVKPFDVYKFDVINVVIAAIMGMYFNWHITKLRLGLELSTTMLEEERNKYLNQSTTDELTQLNNRRDFMATFQRYLSNYRTSDDFLCIAISDIDFFKFYNDYYGHPKGDDCLRSVGTAFNKLKDSMGVYAARVGGEEFAMLWFEKDASHVDAVVSYMSSLIRNLKIPHEKSKVSEYVTMSMGVYVEKLGADHADVKTLYDLADKALYTAKGSGRNCTVVVGRDIAEYKITPPTG
ncbi:MAG: GGDEF domain-containing protein [Treponema sp.]|jgi:diguanylate cyclase (GGDEF)-like protein|nr:GGDEF domain-containing protein [Treponema sp.]